MLEKKAHRCFCCKQRPSPHRPSVPYIRSAHSKTCSQHASTSLQLLPPLRSFSQEQSLTPANTSPLESQPSSSILSTVTAQPCLSHWMEALRTWVSRLGTPAEPDASLSLDLLDAATSDTSGLLASTTDPQLFTCMQAIQQHLVTRASSVEMAGQDLLRLLAAVWRLHSFTGLALPAEIDCVLGALQAQHEQCNSGTSTSSTSSSSSSSSSSDDLLEGITPDQAAHAILASAAAAGCKLPHCLATPLVRRAAAAAAAAGEQQQQQRQDGLPAGDMHQQQWQQDQFLRYRRLVLTLEALEAARPACELAVLAETSLVCAWARHVVSQASDPSECVEVVVRAARAFCGEAEGAAKVQPDVNSSSSNGSSSRSDSSSGLTGVAERSRLAASAQAAVAELAHVACCAASRSPPGMDQLSMPELTSLANALEMCNFMPMAQLQVEASVAQAAAAAAAASQSNGEPGDEGGSESGDSPSSSTVLSSSSSAAAAAMPGATAIVAPTCLDSSNTSSSEEHQQHQSFEEARGNIPAAAMASPQTGGSEEDDAGSAAGSSDGRRNISDPEHGEHSNALPARPGAPSAAQHEVPNFDGQPLFHALLLGGRLRRCSDGEEVMGVLRPLAAAYLLPQESVLQALRERVQSVCAELCTHHAAAFSLARTSGTSPDGAAEQQQQQQQQHLAAALHEVCLGLFVLLVFGHKPGPAVTNAKAALGPHMCELAPADLVYTVWAFARVDDDHAPVTHSCTAAAMPRGDDEQQQQQQQQQQQVQEGEGQHPFSTPRSRLTKLADIAAANTDNAAARAASDLQSALQEVNQQAIISEVRTPSSFGSSSTPPQQPTPDAQAAIISTNPSGIPSPLPPASSKINLSFPPFWLLQAHNATSRLLTSSNHAFAPHQLSFLLASFERIAAAAAAVAAASTTQQLSPQSAPHMSLPDTAATAAAAAASGSGPSWNGARAPTWAPSPNLVDQMLEAFRAAMLSAGGPGVEGTVTNTDATLMLASCARLGHIPGYAWTEDMIEGFCLQRLTAFSPKEIATLAWSMASIRHQPSEELVSRLCSAAQRSLPEFTADNISTLVWSLAELGLESSSQGGSAGSGRLGPGAYLPGSGPLGARVAGIEFLDVREGGSAVSGNDSDTEAREQLEVTNGDEPDGRSMSLDRGTSVSSSSSSSGSSGGGRGNGGEGMEGSPVGQLLRAVCAEALSRMTEFAPRDMVSLLASFARLKHPPPPEWLSAYLQAIKRYLPFLDGQASATVLSSLVALNARVTNSEWLQHFCRTTEPQLSSMDAPTLTSIAMGLAQMGHSPDEAWGLKFVEAAEQASLPQKSLTGQQQVQLVCAMSELPGLLPSRSQMLMLSGTLSSVGGPDRVLQEAGGPVAMLRLAVALSKFASQGGLEHLPPANWLNTSFTMALRLSVRGVSLPGADAMARALAAMLAAQPDLRLKAPEIANLLSHLREFFLYSG